MSDSGRAGMEQSRPLRRDAESNRARILAAARELIAVRGLGVGHNEIARAAEVAVGTVYRRFPDKEALVDALFIDRLDEVVDAAEAARDITDPWLALVTFMNGAVAAQASNRGLGDLALGAARGMKLSTEARERVGPVVAEIVQRAQAAGVLRPDVTEQDLALVPAMLAPIVANARGIDDELWRRVLALVLDGFRAGMADVLPGTPPAPEVVDAIMSNWNAAAH
ncbi:AcrR family transcriptional regulator [Nakamurella sp. UYEF19]|uniref:TetR/AcrR family transcriptional regulator n=1 Tax=Nakamurella sp. UYEF19 TaxID=1756392 RepID=UPI0033928A06